MTSRARTAVLISGRGSNMIALIEAARSPDFSAEIVLVLSDDPPRPAFPGRGSSASPPRRSTFGAYAGKPAFEAALDARLAAASVEIVCLAGFMRLLSPSFVERWRGRILNIHPSLLPDLRGLNTHERALAQGLAEHGCTVHLVTAELDAGPILAQARVPVLSGDDAHVLAARVLKEEHRIYPQALDELARSLRAAPGARVIASGAAAPSRRQTSNWVRFAKTHSITCEVYGIIFVQRGNCEGRRTRVPPAHEPLSKPPWPRLRRGAIGSIFR